MLIILFDQNHILPMVHTIILFIKPDIIYIYNNNYYYLVTTLSKYLF